MNPYFNENTVLDYIKQSLGVPYNVIEFSDEELVNNIILNHNYLKEFSQYFPKEERVELNMENNQKTVIDRLKYTNPEKYDSYSKSEELSNRWYLNVDNEILGVRKIISSSSNEVLAFYSDVINYGNPLDYATGQMTRSMAEQPMTHIFYYPNVVEVRGYPKNRLMTAVLDVVHDKDLSSIPSTLHHSYNKLCLYNTANALLGIRSKYSNMSTPFGELNLNLDYLQSLAEKKTELIQEFKSPANFATRGVAVFVG